MANPRIKYYLSGNDVGCNLVIRLVIVAYDAHRWSSAAATDKLRRYLGTWTRHCNDAKPHDSSCHWARHVDGLPATRYAAAGYSVARNAAHGYAVTRNAAHGYAAAGHAVARHAAAGNADNRNDLARHAVARHAAARNAAHGYAAHGHAAHGYAVDGNAATWRDGYANVVCRTVRSLTTPHLAPYQ